MPKLFGPSLIDQPPWSAHLPLFAGTTASMVQGRYVSLGDTGCVSQLMVQANRQQLMYGLGLGRPLVWLKQSHSVVITSDLNQPEADGAFTSKVGFGVVVQTADCMPILLYDAYTHTVYALHVGWRGLLAGMIRVTLARLLSYPQYSYAWIGPSITQAHYQVSTDFIDRFYVAGYRESAFFNEKSDEVYANLQAMAHHDLASLGMRSITCSTYCTYREPLCFSHRRSVEQACYQGRMASFIGLDSA